MESTKILAIVQAGGAGGRMDVLTLERAKPALPFAGSYQLLDFPLSNLVNSGIDDVWLSVQYQASALQDQVRNGRPWDLDRTRGGLRLLMPQEGTGSMDEEGFAHGNADELYRLRDQIGLPAPDLVLVMSADHVYRLDYRDVVDTHRAKDAEVTVVATDLGRVRRGPGRPRGRRGEPARSGDLLRLQAREAGVHDGGDRGVPLPARRAHRDAGAAAPRAVRRAPRGRRRHGRHRAGRLR